MPSVSPKTRFTPHLFTKDSHGGSGKGLLARIGDRINNLGSPTKRASPKVKGSSGVAAAPVSGGAFADVAEALVSAAALEPSLVVAFGFVPGLVALLRPGAATEPCAVSAAKALASLAQSREHHAALREAGTLPVLVAVLTSPQLSLIHI